MNPSYNNHNNDDDDDDDAIHDQLPSVEEYKSNLAPGSNKIDPKRIMESVMMDNDDDDVMGEDEYGSTVPPSSVSDESELPSPYFFDPEADVPALPTTATTTNNNNKDDDYYYYNDDDDDEEMVHDQLPTVEEIHAQRAETTKRRSTTIPKLSIPDHDHGLRRLGICIATILFLCAIIIPPVIFTMNDRYTERREYLYNFLTSESMGILPIVLDDPSSPQAKAYEFLSREPFDNQALSLDKLAERYALTVWYYATDGPNWSFSMNFLTNQDACEWNAYFRNTRTNQITNEGVICDAKTRRNANGGVRYIRLLDMPNNNLTGTIPPDLQFLSNSLEQMHTEFNPRLTGDMPFTMSRLTNLWSIELQYCNITGSIPDWLGRDLPLRRLGLSNNFLSGSIPPTLLQQTKLQLLALDDNDLSADMEDFAALTNLRFLYMEDNALTGTISNAVIQGWTKMEELDLSYNNLGGELPVELFLRMTNLQVLDIHGNTFRGSIPDQVAINNRIDFMAMQENALTGTIPTSLTDMIDLQHLDLSQNQLVGTIPDGIGKLSFLRYLFLGNNDYSPQNMTMELFQLTNLRELSLKKANLVGTLPAAIANLTKLDLLDLDQNELNGELPMELGVELTGLDFLLLNRNQFTGTIPPSFEQLTQLNILLLDHNQLTGSLTMMCNGTKPKEKQLTRFVSDCAAIASANGEFAGEELVCPCCSTCCNDANATCNNYDWDVNLDPIWEYGYNRRIFTFSQNVIESSAV